MVDIFKQVILSEELCDLGTQTTKQVDPTGEAILPSESSTEAYSQLQEQAREQGYKIGFEQGVAEGLVKGEQLAKNQVEELVQQLNHLLNSISSALQDSRQALKAEIADIVLAITQQFFMHQQQNKEAIAQQITATLNYLNNKQAITLALNPQDLALLQQGELKVDFSSCKDLRVIADETLSLGGCRINTEHGMFDASIERQIDCLKQALLQIKKRYSHG